MQSFPNIIEEGYAYVDKTNYIKPLIKQGRFFFLSRPRRFGKSLMLSTLKSYFDGRRDLFRGLAADGVREAMDQIHDRDYAGRFAMDSRKVYLIAANYVEKKEHRGLEYEIEEA